MTKQFKVLYKVSIIILAILAAMTIGSIILMTIGADVVKTYRVILFEPLKTTLQLSEVLLRAIPLTIIALGISVAYRSGIINIGAEGQMAMGILGTTAVALAFPELPKPVLLPMAILAGAISGGVWGFIPGFLKAKLQVSELLSTVMLNYIAAQFYTFLLRGPMLDPAELTMGSGTPQSMRLSRNLWLDRFLPGTRLHTGLFFALILALLIYLLLWKTSYGYKMRAAGASSRAAKYGGINVTWYLVIAMVISGAFAGMAGAIEIAGVHRRAIEGITGGYGFSGIVVALFGGLHPAGIIPASFFFGLLIVGADMTQRMVGVPANMVNVLQGIIILVIVATKMVLADPYLMEKVWRKVQKRSSKSKEVEA
ncbi:MAG: ABC transporter permease [Sphaerochaeta sp.]|jgi:simple sugar transport system permease protein|uniref:ABC transporter permease n=1 Tax=unclassified Sphaerochaeta TaxID=2637943 RepID=UPI0025F8C85A|nr:MULTISPECIES: ABC transporter permease [unclassified Sphaerochaeta]MCK9600722.1 ABC transporter permease [Sphaerochaeta sp.]MDX9824443.1 ABC transporter permease [Sphaerochaeta sp.]